MRCQKTTRPIWIIIGLVLIGLSPVMALSEDFTVVVVPDTQFYSSTYPDVYADQTQWIVDNKEARNVVYVAHEGDIVNNWTYTRQWDRAEEAMKLLDGTATTIERRVASSSDDAEELDDGSIYLNSVDLEFMRDPSLGDQSSVGMRWTNVNIPVGAAITRAYIRFTADEVGSIDADVSLYGEASDDAQTFTDAPFNISGRSKTINFVDWTEMIAWETVGESGGRQRTPDLTVIIQEIIDTDGWQAGNNLAIIAEPLTSRTGPRTAESYNGSSSMAPLLHVEYTTSSADIIPYSVLPGNHDGINYPTFGIYDTRLYNIYFGFTLFENRSQYGGQYGQNNDNNFGLFSAGGMDFILINLAFFDDGFPSDTEEILNWADDRLQEFSDHRAIVVSHWLINEDGNWSYPGTKIWESLKDRSNLFLMLGGHVHHEVGREDEGDNGNTVRTLLANYQDRGDGGDGWLRILEFSPDNNVIRVKTYSPWLNEWERDADSEFTLNYDMGGSGNVVEVLVKQSSDDAEESASGSISQSSSDLELVYDSSHQTVGLRFSGVAIPQYANIVNAYVQFQVDETSSVPTSLTIEGEAIDDAPTFTSASGNISSRERTSTNVSWSPVPWTTIGQAGPDQQTPDISRIIQEIVDQSGWLSGNSLALIITGTGTRVAESYDGDPAGTPLLHVKYVPACECDFAPPDGDVDGEDLAVYIANQAGISLADFAAAFGRDDCP